ncbi:Hsp70 family protein [Methylococcus sp. EFPC2]|uniref:Hsp70 family protein n=1 Tax=Methylococcus sp. EFPC2 TaxID=2812648 RepID=UPI001967890D|nr:Hsp70 family protein [Methylococcus sp. EFPC2]QSA97180.1 Hsp70 family protein [Methylococcus sp. EFPC2]
MSEPRYSVGIDLGTTNSVISYLELSQADGEHAPLEVVAIPQLVSPGAVGDKKQLPSFLYQAHEAELAPGDVALPWDEHPEAIVGELARQLGGKTPIRLVASAKSWLCHSGVDCRAAILPIQAPEEVQRVSPLQASIHYLRHLRDAWNAQYPDAPLSEQELVITVPASFDPAARELTVEAAHAVGLRQAILLEEPQSALYSWIQSSGGAWREQVKTGDIILVVDVGGGTADLSLIAVTEDEGNLVLNRIAIGDHILLGGDNMDLALAYVLKLKLEKEGKRLEPWQIQALTHSCRDAKETLLADPNVAEIPVVVPSRGSSLIGGTLRTSLTREEVSRTLVEGFFPRVTVTDKPAVQARTGLTTLGLPYAKDARITVHLAGFLSRQLNATSELGGFAQPEGARFIHPTALLLNGGVFKSEPLSRRLLDVLNDWLQSDGAPAARLLAGADLDLAVARGAAYYGYVRQGKGVRIRGGTAAAYYVGVESAVPAVPGFPPPLEALCIAPFGMEEGTRAELPHDEFGLVVGEPVRFRFFGSTLRRDDQVGARLDYWSEGELEELDEIEVTLSADRRQIGEVVPVHLAAQVSEVGTLQLEAVASGGERWKVEFDVRAGEDAPRSAEPANFEEVPENPVGHLQEEASSAGEEEEGKKSFWPFNK